MATPIEQEASAHAVEVPVQTPQATDHAGERPLVQSLETMLARLGYLEREAILVAAAIDVRRDHAIAVQPAHEGRPVKAPDATLDAD